MAAAAAGASASGTTTGDVKRPFDFSVSDFATIVETTAYVDKSLMIRDVYKASSRILITAPPRFGKSTNLDMVKRFLEIEVDTRGIAKPVQTTNSYKLFTDYNLEICKDVGFFNEHFGKYPVVYIDFKPLGRVYDSAEIFDALKMIVKNSLNQHNYILQSSQTEQMFSVNSALNANDCRKYVSDCITEDVDTVNLTNSFNHLSTNLKRYFGKKVFILIDSYDAFLDSPIIKNKTDRKIMVSFVEQSIGQLLNNANCIDRVLITGVIPLMSERYLSSEHNIERYHFLDSHPFTKYYGLTSDEVDTVLIKVIKCNEDRIGVKNKINDYYSAYGSNNGHISVYNVWSVLQYVGRRRVRSYWCDPGYIGKFKKCLNIEPIRQKLEELLLGNELQLDMSQPLSITNVLKVNSLDTSGKDDEDEHLSIDVELFLSLLYHFGYLSVFREYELARGTVYVNIPSEEIKYELAKAVFDENRELYSNPRVNDILSDLDEIQPYFTTDLHKNFDKFIGNVSCWFKSNNFQFTHVLKCLFMNLVTRTDYSRVMALNSPPAVVLMNRHHVAVCVTCDGVQSAERVHFRVIHDCGEKRIFKIFNFVYGKVIIAIDSLAGIAYSYYFKPGDNLQEVTALPES